MLKWVTCNPYCNLGQIEFTTFILWSEFNIPLLHKFILESNLKKT